MFGSGATRLGEPLIVISPCSLPPSTSVPRAPASLSRYGRSIWNWRRASTAGAVVSAVSDARAACIAATRWESSAVGGGPSGFKTGLEGPGSTQAPLSRSR